MKKIINITLLFAALFIGIQNMHAQDVPPPPPDHGASTDQDPGGGAPIGSGLFILLGMAGAYGGMKGYKYFKKEKEEQ
ncbi:MAG: hypothetical protein JXR65_06145 [Bacteroidales bacterium]|nr:hypothetical protein [Bacteroidales bacterium]